MLGSSNSSIPGANASVLPTAKGGSETATSSSGLSTPSSVCNPPDQEVSSIWTDWCSQRAENKLELQSDFNAVG